MGKIQFITTVFILVLYFSAQLPTGECCVARWFSSSKSEETTPNPNQAANKPNDAELLDKVVSSAIQNLFETVINNQIKMNFACPETNGTFPDEIDCHSYYVCENSNFTVHKCMNESFGFDKVTKECIQKDAIKLCQLLERNPDFVCTANGLFPHPVDCRKFVVCVKEVGYTSSCSDGQYYFDSEKSMCIPIPNKEHLDCADLNMRNK